MVSLSDIHGSQTVSVFLNRPVAKKLAMLLNARASIQCILHELASNEKGVSRTGSEGKMSSCSPIMVWVVNKRKKPVE